MEQEEFVNKYLEPAMKHYIAETNLLEAAEQMESALECCHDDNDWREYVMGPARRALQAAIKQMKELPKKSS